MPVRSSGVLRVLRFKDALGALELAGLMCKSGGLMQPGCAEWIVYTNELGDSWVVVSRRQRREWRDGIADDGWDLLWKGSPPDVGYTTCR